MNSLLSEIFGCYYKVVTEIVNNSPLSIDEIKQIIEENGFSESCFHLLPKIETLPFIEKRGCKYYSLLENKIKLPLTNIEKSWLKAITNDVRFELFAPNYSNLIFDKIEPLYNQADFKFYDKYSDGDDFNNYYYKKYFNKINAALNTKTPIKIIYKSPKNRITVNHYIPLKFEFSSKDDKFRFFAARIKNNKLIDYVSLNMGRILDVRSSSETYEGSFDVESHIQKFDQTEHIIIEIYNDRNAIERFMVEFSSYRKESEFDDSKEICTTKIYYRKTDEIEVLIKLLSFGPTLKVIGPERFLKLLKYRIQKQYEMVKN